MLKSLFSGVTGLQSHQIAMDVESNNIANVNTIGYKYSRANFSDLLAQTNQIATAPQGALGGKNPVQIGLGASVNSVTRIFSQGSIQNTDKNTDVAIQGDGFFVVSSDGGSTYKYSRSGDFKFDGSGNFVDNNGFIVQGWLRDKTTGLVDATAPIANIQIPPGLTTPASGTSEVVIKANLSSGDHVDQYKPIYTLDNISTNLTGADTIASTSDDDRPENFNVLFNATGDALNLQEGQGMWVSYASSSLTQTLSGSATGGTATFTINNETMNATIPAGATAAEVVAIISAKINSTSTVTGVSATPSPNDPTVITLNNDNTRGTTASSKNINLSVSAAAGTGLSAGVNITSFQYTFTQAGPVPIVETDASGAIRQFTTTEDLRARMQYDANLVGDDRNVYNFAIPTLPSSTTTFAAAGVAQVDTFTVGAVADGDVFDVTIEGTTISYTAAVPGDDSTSVAATLVGLINSNAAVNATVTAAIDPLDPTKFTLTENANTGVGFTATTTAAALVAAATTPAAPGISQVDTLNIGADGVAYDVGDTFLVTVNGTPVSYTAVSGDTSIEVAQNLLANINAAGLGVTASINPSDPTGSSLLLTENVNAGVGFTVFTGTADAGSAGNNIFDAGITVEINERGQFDIKNPGGTDDNYDMRVNVTGLTGTGVTENTRFTQNFQTLAGTLTTGSSISRLSQAFNAASHSASIDVFDSLGTKHTLRLDFRKTELLPSGGSTWIYEMSVPAPGDIGGSININELLGTDAGRISFDNTGALAVATTTSISYTANNGSAPNQTINLNFGTIGQFDGITSFDNPSGTSGISQDGFPGGDLLGIRIDQSGTLIGSFSNGRSFGLAQIGMAKFSNNEGLVTDGGNVYLQSANSGDPIIGTAATAGRGFMQSSALEASNVDLSKSLTNLIIVQRGYQANAKTITTSDTLLETLLGIKR